LFCFFYCGSCRQCRSGSCLSASGTGCGVSHPAAIAPSLVAIQRGSSDLVWSADGTKVLVVTWKSQSGYEKFLKPAVTTSGNADYAVWVTAVPRVQRFCSSVAKTDSDQAKLDLRLKQFLGLDRSEL
jgi:hypothetical protein